MRISIVKPTELGPNELAAWRGMQEADIQLANPFLSPEFAVATARIRPKSRVAVLEDGRDIVGFFPFERQGAGFGTPICPGHNDCHGLVHSPNVEWDPQELLRACGLAVWEFDHLVDGQDAFEPFRTHSALSPIMDLTDGYEAFLAQLRQRNNRLSNVARKQRKMHREVGDVRFVFDSEGSELLHTVLAWKSAQYRRTGWADRFAKSWFVELLETLAVTKSDNFAGVMSIMYAGDTPVAGHFGIRSRNVLAHWFPAYDTNFGDYSPGLAMHLGLAEHAAAADIAHIDMGPGTEAYKEWFRSRDLVVSEGAVLRGYAGVALYRARREPVKRFYEAVEANPSLYRVAKRVRSNVLRVESRLRQRRTRLAASNLRDEGTVRLADS